MRRNLSRKICFLDTQLDFFPDNLDDEHGKRRFHEQKEVPETMEFKNAGRLLLNTKQECFKGRTLKENNHYHILSTVNSAYKSAHIVHLFQRWPTRYKNLSRQWINTTYVFELSVKASISIRYFPLATEKYLILFWIKHAIVMNSLDDFRNKKTNIITVSPPSDKFSFCWTLENCFHAENNMPYCIHVTTIWRVQFA